jgi:hypothetical protein
MIASTFGQGHAELGEDVGRERLVNAEQSQGHVLVLHRPLTGVVDRVGERDLQARHDAEAAGARLFERARPKLEPTNNAAERGLRAAVIYRKLSLGSRSQGGERTIERLLSVDQTCRLQRRSLYSYLVDALTAKARGDPVPSLT